VRSAIRDVHGDFHAETQVDGARGFPFHVRDSYSNERFNEGFRLRFNEGLRSTDAPASKAWQPGAGRQRGLNGSFRSLPEAEPRRNEGFHECVLMIFMILAAEA
jgi:hypothetical protein